MKIFQYYLFGLAIQKGTPFVIIPLITWYFGETIYTNYILLISVAQFISIFISMGCINAVIVFWHEHRNKNHYVTRFLLLLFLLQIISAAAVYPFLKYYLSDKESLLQSSHIISLTLLYIFSYTITNVGAAILRAKILSKHYFVSVLTGSLLLCILVVAVGIRSKNLVSLLSIFIAVNFLQGALFILFSKVKLEIKNLFRGFYGFSKEILEYSFPIMIYTLVTMSLITVDKWVVEMNFSEAIFIEYIYNHQFAYVVNLISIVINMYSIPTFCKLLSENKQAEIKHILASNYKLTILVSALSAIASYTYAHMTHIHLTSGYWIFSLAFIFANIFTLNVSLLEALKSSKRLLALTFWPTLIFWLFFVGSALLHSPAYLYWLFSFYYIWLVYSSMRCINKSKLLESPKAWNTA